MNAAPASTPQPNPPNDNLTWNTQFVTTVVTQMDGHRWSRTRIGGHLGLRDNAPALLALTAPFEHLGKGIRGSFTVKLTGQGDVRIAFRSLQSERFDGDYLGGYSISNYVPGGGSGVGYLTGSTLKSALEDNSWVAWDNLGTAVNNYPGQGQTIHLNWSIDQQNRTLVLGADGGKGSVTYPATIPNGMSNTPLKRIMIQVFVRNFRPDSGLFFDNLRVEEFK